MAASGRTIAQLSTAEVEALLGGGPEVARAQTRLVQLLDLGYRMGLLSSGAQQRGHASGVVLIMCSRSWPLCSSAER